MTAVNDYQSEREVLHSAEMKEEFTTQTAMGGNGDDYLMSYQITRCERGSEQAAGTPVSNATNSLSGATSDRR